MGRDPVPLRRASPRRAGGIVCMVVAFAIALAAPANASSVLWVPGTSGSLGAVLSQIFTIDAPLLGGAYEDDTITTVEYPSAIWPITGVLDPTLGISVTDGVANLEAAVTALATTSGSLVVIGVSQGAMVVQQAAAAMNADLSVSSDTTFVLIADPNFGLFANLHGVYIPILDYSPIAMPETRFNIVVVVNQYDGFAEPITQPWNLLTVINALMGIYYVHALAHTTDLSTVPAENITTTTNSQGGTTTVYYVPTEKLPLTMPLRDLGVPDDIVDAIDAQLRPIIDQGYDPVPATRPAASALSSATASLPLHTGSTGRKRSTTKSATKGGGSATSTKSTGGSKRKR